MGRVAVYAGTCGGEGGLEGEAECRGSRELRTGVYARDNTFGNMLATLAQCSVSITCSVDEADCSHDEYHHDGKTGDRRCGRDNTALGLMLVLA